MLRQAAARWSMKVPTASRIGHRTLFDGLKSKIYDKLEKKREKKQGESFIEQLETMRNVDKFDLYAYKTLLEKNTSGWQAKMPGASSAPGMKEAQRAVKIMQAIEPECMKNPIKLVGKVKRQTVERSGETSEALNAMLRQYEYMKQLHSWFKSREARNLPLPQTQDELTDMVAQDRTGMSMTQLRSKPRRN